jgi:hypothetical protein
MSGIVGSKFNHRGSGPVAKIGTDGQHLLSSGAGKKHIFETVTATAYDDEPIKSDLTALALREATNEASAAFNLPSSFIESFNDDTNLGTQTDCDRTGGYMITESIAFGAFANDSDTKFLLHSDTTNGSTTFTDSSSNSYSITVNGDVQHSTTKKKVDDSSIYFDGTGDRLLPNIASLQPGTGAYTVEFWINTTSTSETFLIMSADTSGTGMRLSMLSNGTIHLDEQVSNADYVATSSSAVNNGNWHHVAISRASSGSAYIYINGTSEANISANHNFDNSNVLHIGSRASANYLTGYLDEIRFSSVRRYSSTFTPNNVTTFNATGTLIQSANTVASAKTKVGGTMLYKDNEGTATLGTDLKIYFSCNNGGAWTEAASYNAITPVYSTGVKQVRLGETTCTSGTGVIYKAVWANQSSGSKETQLHGIGINY